MTHHEILKQWLANRQRNYAGGLALFKLLAKSAVKEKYAAYFDQVKGNPNPFDPHFTQLVNCLTRIENDIRMHPKQYPEALKEVVVSEPIKEATEPERKAELNVRQEKIVTHEQQIQELTEKIEKLEGCDGDNSEEISTLQDQLDEHRAELEQLRKDVDALNTPGIKIVKEDALPKSLKKKYARIKEITPLYASLHNDIANPALTPDQRKPLANQLCKLDDERRRLWKEIDAWAEGATLELEEKRPEFSDNPIVRGIELMRHVKRLKQNIANSQRAADKAKEYGRQVVYDNAMDRIEKYKIDLEESEKELSGE
jgi:predicted RNase H-like nuclease (RuvC/YqgF family)